MAGESVLEGVTGEIRKLTGESASAFCDALIALARAGRCSEWQALLAVRLTHDLTARTEVEATLVTLLTPEHFEKVSATWPPEDRLLLAMREQAAGSGSTSGSGSRTVSLRQLPLGAFESVIAHPWCSPEARLAAARSPRSKEHALALLRLTESGNLPDSTERLVITLSSMTLLEGRAHLARNRIMSTPEVSLAKALAWAEENPSPAAALLIHSSRLTDHDVAALADALRDAPQGRARSREGRAWKWQEASVHDALKRRGLPTAVWQASAQAYDGGPTAPHYFDCFLADSPEVPDLEAGLRHALASSKRCDQGGSREAVLTHSAFPISDRFSMLARAGARVCLKDLRSLPALPSGEDAASLLALLAADNSWDHIARVGNWHSTVRATYDRFPEAAGAVVELVESTSRPGWLSARQWENLRRRYPAALSPTTVRKIAARSMSTPADYEGSWARVFAEAPDAEEFPVLLEKLTLLSKAESAGALPLSSAGPWAAASLPELLVEPLPVVDTFARLALEWEGTAADLLTAAKTLTSRD